MTGGNRPATGPMISLLILNNKKNFENPTLFEYIAGSSTTHSYNTRSRANQPPMSDDQPLPLTNPDSDHGDEEEDQLMTVEQQEEQDREEEEAVSNPDQLHLASSSSSADPFSHEISDEELKKAWIASYKGGALPRKVRDLTMWKHELLVAKVYNAFPYKKSPSYPAWRVCDVTLTGSKKGDPHYLLKLTQIKYNQTIVSKRNLSKDLDHHFQTNKKAGTRRKNRTIFYNSTQRQHGTHKVDTDDPRHTDFPPLAVPSVPSSVPPQKKRRRSPSPSEKRRNSPKC